MEIKILFKNTSYLILTRVVKFSVGFIRAKLIAIFLGTFGTGIIAQLTQVTELMARFTVSGMTDGLVKEIAESDKDDIEFRNKFAVFVKTYISIVSVVLVLVVVVCLFFSRQLTIYFFGDDKFRNFLLIGLAAFPILVINGISFAMLRSFKEIKYIARTELIVLVLNIIIFIPLIFIWGLTGAAIYIALAYISTLVVTHYYAKKIILRRLDINLSFILRAKINRKVIKELFLFASFGLTAGVALIVTDAVTRVIIVNKLGVNEIGIYTPVIIWTSLFAGLIMPSISTYLYPRYCESKSNTEMVNLMNDSLRFVTLLMIPFILLSIPIRFQIIPFFYSDEFVSAGIYLPWHFLGILFYMWMYIFDQAMKPTGRIKTSGVVIIIMSIMDVLVVYLLTPYIGLYAFMLKFLISPTLFFFFYIIYWRNQIGFKLFNRNILLMGYLVMSFMLLLVCETYFTTNVMLNLFLGSLLTVLSFLILTKNERKIILQKISREFTIRFSAKRITVSEK